MSAIAKEPSRIDVDLIREAFDRTPVGLVVISPDGIVRLVNRALAEMMGRPRQAIEGQPFQAFVPPSDIALEQQKLDAIRAGGEPARSEERRVGKECA